MRRLFPSWQSTLVVGFCLGVAVIAQLTIGRGFGPVFPWVPFSFAVFVAAWMGGLRPAVLALLAGYGIVTLLFVRPLDLRLGDRSDYAALFVFTTLGLFAGCITESLHRARERAERSSRRLREEHERLAATLQDLASVDRKKDEFIAMLAHELRNPLAAIRYANHLGSTPDLAEREGFNVTEMIEHEVSHLARLIDDLLDVSRLDRGRITLQQEHVDARQVAKRAASALRPRFQGKLQDFQLSLGNQPLPVEADPTRLQQVLENLLSNAAKYTPDGGQIRLEAGRSGGGVILSVRDNGAGIPPESLGEVFEPFCQLPRTLARSDGGLGVGLTLAKRLVELHGGTITAQSGGPGQGSKFTVRLPSSEAPVPADGQPIEAIADSAGLRLLIVEDNQPAASLLRTLLVSRGFAVEVAHDGLEAVEVAPDFRPDVVLLDIGLPGLDGYQVAKRLRGNTATKNAHIIGLSGYGQQRDRERSRQAGFDQHLVKPVEFTKLLPLLKPRVS